LPLCIALYIQGAQIPNGSNKKYCVSRCMSQKWGCLIGNRVWSII
jgi:hypothetical protein